ncbi:anti-anti-sigma regulatory factor [Thermocatellispora tengchongensis]|uniref:Anti-anti-sigma regulatory factor n=1 Tax=Thermocatellispora tengchongensis TaxID=1073253 RepID=A0A840PFP9_9ACTN|nr:hypothetical protein [Thermocatellispora tengchongensis]MBB5136290.1 anti-anti-sigma regulatory factor [Thermocatellispora tengchongensis]
MLVSCLRRTRDHGGATHLAALQRSPSHLLKLFGLRAHLRVHDSGDEAVAAACERA